MSPIVTHAAQLACLAIYDPITPGVFDTIYRINETVCGAKLEGNVLRLVLQGTESVDGWKADFDALPFEHPTIGHVHSGFYQNLPALLVQLGPYLRGLAATLPQLEVEVEGHSKGAGEGAILAGLLHAAGYRVVAFLFATPNAGYRDFANYLRANVPGTSFRNAPQDAEWFGDPVPLVPPAPYVAPYPHTFICVPPTGFERLLNVAWHMGDLYYSAFADASQTVTA